ncbi:TPA: hypothetical protein NKU24_004536 [Vibrio parahaemolyticus]|nr:hypothetical protein [Vibrio parahaemolyticus]HCH5272794.1 hypothetical protein [Vibrio parahaemolyticus]
MKKINPNYPNIVLQTMLSIIFTATGLVAFSLFAASMLDLIDNTSSIHHLGKYSLFPLVILIFLSICEEQPLGYEKRNDKEKIIIDIVKNLISICVLFLFIHYYLPVIVVTEICFTSPMPHIDAINILSGLNQLDFYGVTHLHISLFITVIACKIFNNYLIADIKAKEHNSCEAICLPDLRQNKF